VENITDEIVAVIKRISPSKRIILVTSAYHLYRARMLFEKKEFEVITYKADYKIQKNKVITIINFLLSADLL
jgi:uncharacterized SAM-binding protein YcdF (DUF218 family)